jgi:acetylornithine/succinyldiaminopimelate/putrescine aminotransferase
VGALVIGEKAAKTFSPGDHASTFGGNLLAGAAVSCVADHLADTSFLNQINRSAALLKAGLETLKEHFPKTVREVRGKGLMMGIELSQEVKPIISACMEHGLLLVGAGTHVIRFVPPLIVSEQDIREAVQIIEKSFRELHLS